jgi:hypothetical protein
LKAVRPIQRLPPFVSAAWRVFRSPL